MRGEAKVKMQCPDNRSGVYIHIEYVTFHHDPNRLRTFKADPNPYAWVSFWSDVYEANAAGNSEVIVTDDMTEYQRMARKHNSRQPFIENELIEDINSYSCVTYRQLSGHINHWCQHGCIAACMASFAPDLLFVRQEYQAWSIA